MTQQVDDVRIKAIHEVSPPDVVHAEIPRTESATETVYLARQAIHRILGGEDDRLLVIMGPCSVHDPAAALEYAARLKSLREELAEQLHIVMRVYFEKPRTTVGWKGLINDPDLDNSFQINKGLRLARQLLRDLNALGVPAATEFLDLISPQYIADLVSWGAIGARTTESQVHRELASGLSCPVGFKNGTDGNLKIAIDAINSASRPHHFMSLTKSGHSAIFATAGNEDCHLILRGGKTPNYDAECIAEAKEQLEKAGVVPRLMVDCSHGNSRKDHERQFGVGEAVGAQLRAGERGIVGVMLESHLIAGRQDLVPHQPLTYGQSITDACMGWERSEELARLLAEAVAQRRTAGH